MNKLQSRKLIATVVTGLLVVANARLGLGVDQDTINALALLVAVYVVTQGFVDAKQGK